MKLGGLNLGSCLIANPTLQIWYGTRHLTSLVLDIDSLTVVEDEVLPDIMNSDLEEKLLCASGKEGEGSRLRCRHQNEFVDITLGGESQSDRNDLTFCVS